MDDNHRIAEQQAREMETARPQSTEEAVQGRRQIMYSARLASRLPPRLRRWRTTFPEEASTGDTPQRLAKEASCDGAYGSADVRAKLGELGVRVVAKLRSLTDSKHFRKDEFEIDLRANDGAGSVTCPAGVTITDFRMARDGWYRPVKLFRFPREACEECDLKELCLGGPNGRAENPVRLPPGRQVQMHYHEEVLQNARAEQRTADQKKVLRDKLRPRAKVERKISEVLRLHGLRRGRYFGGQKTDLQALMTATMVNSKRLFTLTDETADLAEALREELAA